MWLETSVWERLQLSDQHPRVFTSRLGYLKTEIWTRSSSASSQFSFAVPIVISDELRNVASLRKKKDIVRKCCQEHFYFRLSRAEHGSLVGDRVKAIAGDIYRRRGILSWNEQREKDYSSGTKRRNKNSKLTKLAMNDIDRLIEFARTSRGDIAIISCEVRDRPNAKRMYISRVRMCGNEFESSSSSLRSVIVVIAMLSCLSRLISWNLFFVSSVSSRRRVWVWAIQFWPNILIFSTHFFFTFTSVIWRFQTFFCDVVWLDSSRKIPLAPMSINTTKFSKNSNWWTTDGCKNI